MVDVKWQRKLKSNKIWRVITKLSRRHLSRCANPRALLYTRVRVCLSVCLCVVELLLETFLFSALNRFAQLHIQNLTFGVRKGDKISFLFLYKKKRRKERGSIFIDQPLQHNGTFHSNLFSSFFFSWFFVYVAKTHTNISFYALHFHFMKNT